MASSRAVEDEDSICETETDEVDNSTPTTTPSKVSRRSSRDDSEASGSKDDRRVSRGSDPRIPKIAETEERINFQSLLKFLNDTKRPDGTLNLDSYIHAYRELNKFFNMMGSIFSFVSKDVKAKIIILENHRRSGKGDCYRTIQGMIDYEKKSNMLKNGAKESTTPVNGCRTLLRLHRALEFIKVFLARLSEVKNEEKVSTCAQEAYNATLAKYHPWLIQKAAIVAMYSLPHKPELIKRTCVQNLQDATAVLPEVVRHISVVYDSTQALYKANGLLDLP